MGNFTSLILYISVYLSSSTFLFFSQKSKKYKAQLLFLIAIILPVLLAAFRYEVGTDYIGYKKIYEKSSIMTLNQWISTELDFSGVPFGIWLVSRVSGLFNSHILFFGLMALIIYLPVAWTLKTEYSGEVVFLGSLLFLTTIFSNGFNGIKQCAAISILFFGLKYISKRRIFPYILTVLIASLFHPTAIVALLLYFLEEPQNKGITWKRFLIFSIVIFGLFIYPEILKKMGGRWENYIEYEGDISNKIFYLELILLVFFLTFFKSFSGIDCRNELYIVIFFFGGLFELLGFISPYIKRIALYYTFPQYLLIPQCSKLFIKN